MPRKSPAFGELVQAVFELAVLAGDDRVVATMLAECAGDLRTLGCGELGVASILDLACAEDSSMMHALLLPRTRSRADVEFDVFASPTDFEAFLHVCAGDGHAGAFKAALQHAAKRPGALPVADWTGIVYAAASTTSLAMWRTLCDCMMEAGAMQGVVGVYPGLAAAAAPPTILMHVLDNTGIRQLLPYVLQRLEPLSGHHVVTEQVVAFINGLAVDDAHILHVLQSLLLATDCDGHPFLAAAPAIPEMCATLEAVLIAWRGPTGSPDSPWPVQLMLHLAERQDSTLAKVVALCSVAADKAGHRDFVTPLLDFLSQERSHMAAQLAGVCAAAQGGGQGHDCSISHLSGGTLLPSDLMEQLSLPLRLALLCTGRALGHKMLVTRLARFPLHLQDMTLLTQAVAEGRIPIPGERPTATWLELLAARACLFGNPELLRWVLRQQCGVLPSLANPIAAARGVPDTVRPLEQTALRGHFLVLCALLHPRGLECGVDVQNHGCEALKFAAGRGHYRIVKKLLSHRAQELRPRLSQEAALLIISQAVDFGHAKVLRLLLLHPLLRGFFPVAVSSLMLFPAPSGPQAVETFKAQLQAIPVLHDQAYKGGSYTLRNCLHGCPHSTETQFMLLRRVDGRRAVATLPSTHTELPLSYLASLQDRDVQRARHSIEGIAEAGDQVDSSTRGAVAILAAAGQLMAELRSFKLEPHTRSLVSSFHWVHRKDLVLLRAQRQPLRGHRAPFECLAVSDSLQALMGSQAVSRASLTEAALHVLRGRAPPRDILVLSENKAWDRALSFAWVLNKALQFDSPAVLRLVLGPGGQPTTSFARGPWSRVTLSRSLVASAVYSNAPRCFELALSEELEPVTLIAFRPIRYLDIPSVNMLRGVCEAILCTPEVQAADQAERKAILTDFATRLLGREHTQLPVLQRWVTMKGIPWWSDALPRVDEVILSCGARSFALPLLESLTRQSPHLHPADLRRSRDHILQVCLRETRPEHLGRIMSLLSPPPAEELQSPRSGTCSATELLMSLVNRQACLAADSVSKAASVCSVVLRGIQRQKADPALALQIAGASVRFLSLSTDPQDIEAAGQLCSSLTREGVFKKPRLRRLRGILRGPRWVTRWQIVLLRKQVAGNLAATGK